jgi:hypothetical protein
MSDKPFYQQQTFWFTLATMVLQLLGMSGVLPKEIADAGSVLTGGGAVLRLRAAVGRN